ncbi:MAG TPA: hypothetical protein VM802_28155 [Chitinophaga sp.]|uniref:GNAT family N-acetyltransferase n=1 Tax=Chitinophaga sp. TaxID=1869181 RepID=UPI002BC76090|nr:GNAT family N-acetyltransferase [Chitinophaga sp.]HVI48775.1 hypothetical protein [Chitinophaga sp.]
MNTTTLQHSEIEDLLALQRSNLVTQISSDTAASQGFLTFQYTAPVLSRMMEDMAQPITKSGDVITGYALSTSREAGMEIALMKPLVEMCDEQLSFNGKPLREQRYYLMGQVCVRDGWRGQGIFDKLYQYHKELFSKDYDCIVTEIAATNLRSQAAHARVGFETIHEHEDGGTVWHVVAWGWK